MGMDIGQELLRMKSRLEKDKNTRLELQGELKSVMKQLQEDFGVSSLEEAEEMQSTMQEEIITIEKQIQEQLQEIRDLMEGEDEE